LRSARAEAARAKRREKQPSHREVPMKRHAFVATLVACVLSLTPLTTSAAQDTTSKKP
jgi:hypothetical protein